MNVIASPEHFTEEEQVLYRKVRARDILAAALELQGRRVLWVHDVQEHAEWQEWSDRRGTEVAQAQRATAEMVRNVQEATKIVGGKSLDFARTETTKHPTLQYEGFERLPDMVVPPKRPTLVDPQGRPFCRPRWSTMSPALKAAIKNIFFNEVLGQPFPLSMGCRVGPVTPAPLSTKALEEYRHSRVDLEDVEDVEDVSPITWHNRG